MTAQRWKMAIAEGRPTPDEGIVEAVAALARGGVVGFPTETVYGLGARGDLPEAHARLASLKGRDPTKPLTLHVATPLDAVAAAGSIPPRALPLLRRFWPGPLTVVVAAPGGGTIGLRVPAHGVAQALLARAGGPVLGTSANRSGEEPICDPDGLEALFGDAIDVLLDAGETQLRQSSTVVHVADQGFSVLREGIVTAAMCRARLTTRVSFVCTGNSCRSPMAEMLFKQRLASLFDMPIGMLAAHGFEVTSAGVAAAPGYPAAPQGVEVMRERGLDLSRHTSRPVDVMLVERANLIVVMTSGHRRSILEWWPEHQDKVVLLDESGVPDPIGGPVDVYRECADHIDRQLDGVLERLFGDALGRAVLAKRGVHLPGAPQPTA